jgi:hypothetical protein
MIKKTLFFFLVVLAAIVASTFVSFHMWDIAVGRSDLNAEERE